MDEQESLERAEANFRQAVQKEQWALMASGIGRVEVRGRQGVVGRGREGGVGGVERF